MPFRHPDRTHDLNARIDFEVRERLEEAIDFVCLEALVQRRRNQGLPAPEADNARDRAEYEANVLSFLRLLGRDMASATDPSAIARRAASGTNQDDQSRLLSAQVVLARSLPDYWQRFERTRARYLTEPEASGGERGGLLRRLFSRG
ncbi:MAG TPA: hypothetical protein VGU22_16895 [Methylomirabilota bacterium]|jgi:hypothetical protein|nr:hypothetical protein [Methylomirabilota bacterium]